MTTATALIEAEFAALKAQAQLTPDRAIAKLAESLTELGVDYCVVTLKNSPYILLQCGGAVTLRGDVYRLSLPVAGSTRQKEFPLRGSPATIAITVSATVEGHFAT